MNLNDPIPDEVREQDICPIACRALWCSVIREQLKLALGVGFQKTPQLTSAAIHWFNTREFFMACALAGLDGAYIHKGVMSLFEKHGVR